MAKGPAKLGWTQRSNLLVLAIVVIFAIAVCALLLNSTHISDSSANIVRSLIWPFFLLIILLLFRAQAETLLIIVLNKIENAQKVSAGPSGFVIEAGPLQIPVPESGEPVTLANLALLHTSWLRKDETVRRGDGLTYYQIEVVIAAPKPTLNRIARVTYRLDPAYPTNEYIKTDASTRFKLKELANGTSIIRAEIEFKSQEERLYINRFIDLRPEGPRI